MQLSEKQLKSFTQILEKMNGKSTLFTPKSKIENIKTFVDVNNNLYISYDSTTATIEGFDTDKRYLFIDVVGTIEYLSLTKNEDQIKNIFENLNEIII
jgi:hypothetical protein